MFLMRIARILVCAQAHMLAAAANFLPFFAILSYFSVSHPATIPSKYNSYSRRFLR